MLKKYFSVLSFLFVVILLMGGSCGTQPTAKLNVVNSPTSTDIQVGQSDSKKFSLENSGTIPLEYTVKPSSSAITLLSKTSGTLEAGRQIDVEFRMNCPLEASSLSETIDVTSSGGNQSVKVEAVCRGTQLSVPKAGYDIDLIFLGPGMTKARQDVFAQAALLWKAIIVGDLEDFPLSKGLPLSRDLPPNERPCSSFDTPALPIGAIDDLLIFASIAPIDGAGKILGQAGPSFIRGNTNDLTIVGCMQFDEADVAALETEGTFNEVILHEMGHVLGYGTLWEPFSINDIDLLDEPCQSNPNATSGFAGPKAVVQFGVLGKTGNPPVENNYTPGTRCGHWDEGFFDNELMTGFLGGVTSTTVNPFSALTIASMADLGYEVNLSEAEPYSVPACSPNCDASRPKLLSSETPWEIILKPRGTLDSKGNIVFFNNDR
jgi:Leishmanolysin